MLLAWIFVVLRGYHGVAWLRAGEGRRVWRLDLASVAVPAAMWTAFLVDFAHAAIVYRQAIAKLLTA